MKVALKKKLAQLEEQLEEADVDEVRELYLAFNVEEEINHEATVHGLLAKTINSSEHTSP